MVINVLKNTKEDIMKERELYTQQVDGGWAVILLFRLVRRKVIFHSIDI